MATYLRGVTDYIPQIQEFKPDYNFYSKALQMKQSKYDAAHKQLSNLYGSLLNAPMLRQENIESRDAFFKAIDQDIQKMAGMDLSLQQNVDAASDIFNQMLDNKNIVNDMVKTKQLYKAKDRSNGFKNCTDPEKCGGQWWEEGDQALDFWTQEFQSASSDDAMRMSGPEYTPYQDVMKKAIQLAKDADLSIETDAITGGYIVTTKNGEQLTPKLAQLFMGSLGSDPNINAMYKTKAYVDRMNWVNQNAQTYGSVEQAEMAYYNNFQDAMSKLADEQDKALQQQTETTSAQKKQVEEQIKKEGTTAGSTLADVYRRLSGQEQALNESSTVHTEAKGGLDVAKRNGYNKASLKAIDGWMANQYLQNDIMNAAGVLSFKDYKQSLKADPYSLENVKFQHRLALEGSWDQKKKHAEDMVKLKHNLENADKLAEELGDELSNIVNQIDPTSGSYDPSLTEAERTEKIYDELQGLANEKELAIAKKYLELQKAALKNGNAMAEGDLVGMVDQMFDDMYYKDHPHMDSKTMQDMYMSGKYDEKTLGYFATYFGNYDLLKGDETWGFGGELLNNGVLNPGELTWDPGIYGGGLGKHGMHLHGDAEVLGMKRSEWVNKSAAEKKAWVKDADLNKVFKAMPAEQMDNYFEKYIVPHMDQTGESGATRQHLAGLWGSQDTQLNLLSIKAKNESFDQIAEWHAKMVPQSIDAFAASSLGGKADATILHLGIDKKSGKQLNYTEFEKNFVNYAKANWKEDYTYTTTSYKKTGYSGGVDAKFDMQIQARTGQAVHGKTVTKTHTETSKWDDSKESEAKLLAAALYYGTDEDYNELANYISLADSERGMMDRLSGYGKNTIASDFMKHGILPSDFQGVDYKYGIDYRLKQAWNEGAEFDGAKAILGGVGIDGKAVMALNTPGVDPAAIKSAGMMKNKGYFKDALSASDANVSFSIGTPISGLDGAGIALAEVGEQSAQQFFNQLVVDVNQAHGKDDDKYKNRPIMNTTYSDIALNSEDWTVLNIKLNSNYLKQYIQTTDSKGKSKGGNLITQSEYEALMDKGLNIYLKKDGQTNGWRQSVMKTDADYVMELTGKVDLNSYPTVTKGMQLISNPGGAGYVLKGDYAIGLNEDGSTKWQPMYNTFDHPNYNINTIMSQLNQDFNALAIEQAKLQSQFHAQPNNKYSVKSPDDLFRM